MASLYSACKGAALQFGGALTQSMSFPCTRSCITILIIIIIWCRRNVGFYMGLTGGIVGEVDDSPESCGRVLCTENLVQAKVTARKIPRVLEKLAARLPDSRVQVELVEVSMAECLPCSLQLQFAACSLQPAACSL